MKMFTQNLRECSCGKTIGSMFWHGRASAGRKWRAEWCFGKFARAFHLRLDFGEGDGDDGVMLIAGIPFLFDLYLSLDGVWRTKPFQTGIAIHNNSFWIYPASWTNESNSSDPWYRRTKSWEFPWAYNWYSTEILEHKAHLPGLAKTVWSESRGNRRKWDEEGDERTNREEIASETYDYTYHLKSGKVQKLKASVHVTRMIWRMRWWPLLPFKKISTSIGVKFDGEVGERTGSYKGGCIGCGYEMREGETPRETLRRMEIERKF